MKCWVNIIAIVILTSFLYAIKDRSVYTKNVDAQFLYRTDSTFVNTWKPLHTFYDSKEMNEGKHISKSEMGITHADSSIVKLKKLSCHLLKYLITEGGNPNEFLFSLSPLKQYKAAVHKQSKLYCSNYSAIFSFFCRLNNLVTRQVESHGSHDNHIVNETFLPETKEWALTDLTYNIIYVKKEQQHLNLLDIYTPLFSEEKTNAFTVYQYKDSSIVKTPFQVIAKHIQYNYDPACSFTFYYETNLAWVYMKREKLKRYFLNNVWFVNYSKTPISNFWAYCKVIGIVLIFVLSIGCLLWYRKR